PVERQKRLQGARPGRQLEHHRRGALRDEFLYSRHELVRELPRGPPPPSHIPRPHEMPWQLEQVLATARQLYHIEQVRGAGDDCARDLAVAAPNPGPLARGVERLT